MNILLLQSMSKHDANYAFRESLCFQHAFERLGHSAVVWGPGTEEFEHDFARVLRGKDVVFVLENYERGGWIPDLIGVKQPTVFWSVDAHCVLKRHVAFCARQKITLLLSSTSRFLKHFPVAHKEWFANCYPAHLISPLAAGNVKTIDVGFCGRTANRGEYIRQLKACPGLNFVHHEMVLGQQMVDAVQSYRIHWNRNVRNDVNYRTFETLGAGTFLLTNNTPDLLRLFKAGRHLVTYRRFEDCVEKARYYLAHEKHREVVAAAGYDFCRRNHTYDVRAQQFIDIVSRL